MSSGLEPALLDTLEALLERLLPGARDAGVRHYIERALSGDYEGYLGAYAEGLAALDAWAVTSHQVPFAALPTERQDAIVASLDSDSDAFLELVRRHVLEGMFGDPRWGGNVDGRGWQLLGYEGPRYAWGAEAQEVEMVDR